MVRTLVLPVLLAAAPAAAETAPRLAVTLAGADQVDGACRLSFLAENALGADLSALALEAVIFDRDGGVERLLLLDFRDVPAGKPRLRQFDLPGGDCAVIGQVLINGADQCVGAAGRACIDALAPASRVSGIEVTG